MKFQKPSGLLHMGCILQEQRCYFVMSFSASSLQTRNFELEAEKVITKQHVP